jgi:hypothetical protein
VRFGEWWRDPSTAPQREEFVQGLTSVLESDPSAQPAVRAGVVSACDAYARFSAREPRPTFFTAAVEHVARALPVGLKTRAKRTLTRLGVPPRLAGSGSLRDTAAALRRQGVRVDSEDLERVRQVIREWYAPAGVAKTDADVA